MKHQGCRQKAITGISAHASWLHLNSTSGNTDISLGNCQVGNSQFEEVLQKASPGGIAEWQASKSVAKSGVACSHMARIMHNHEGVHAVLFD